MFAKEYRLAKKVPGAQEAEYLLPAFGGGLKNLDAAGVDQAKHTGGAVLVVDDFPAGEIPGSEEVVKASQFLGV